MAEKVAKFKKMFIVFGLLICLFLVYSFIDGRKEPDSSGTADIAESTDIYTPGVYTSVISLNDSLLILEIVVDREHINSIRISNLDDAITSMYPLIAPALEKLAEQLYLDVPFESIKLSEESKHTQTLLLESIQYTLTKAEIQSSLDD